MKNHLLIILLIIICFFSCKREISFGEQQIKEGNVGYTTETNSYRADLASGKYVKRDSNKVRFNLLYNISINEDFEDGMKYFDRYGNVLYYDGYNRTVIYHYFDPKQHKLEKVTYGGSSEYFYVRDEYGTLVEEKEINSKGIVQFSKKYLYDEYNLLTEAVIRRVDQKYITKYSSSNKKDGSIDLVEKTTTVMQDGKIKTAFLTTNKSNIYDRINSVHKLEYFGNDLFRDRYISYTYDVFENLEEEYFYGFQPNGRVISEKNSEYLLPKSESIDNKEEYVISFDERGNPISYITAVNGKTESFEYKHLIERDLTDNIEEFIKLDQFECQYYYRGDFWVRAELKLIIDREYTEYYIIERDLQLY